LLIGLAAENEGIGAKALGKCSVSAQAAEYQVTANLDGDRLVLERAADGLGP
jgi:hypothetical protein